MDPSLRDQNNQPVTFEDLNPHGTAIAAMAVGNTLGVAKNANFIGVKWITNPLFMRPTDLVRAWQWVVADVIAKGRQGKAIINLSYGKYSRLEFCCLALLLTIFKPSHTLSLLMSTVT